MNRNNSTSLSMVTSTMPGVDVEESGEVVEREYTLSDAVIALQSDNVDVEDKIQALRFLYEFIENNQDVDVYNRKRLNQLIIDNVLKIILLLDSAGNVNPFRRQLVRVELYILLSRLLQSNALFGAELTQSTVQQIQELTKNEGNSNPPSAPAVPLHRSMSAHNIGIKKTTTHWSPSGTPLRDVETADSSRPTTKTPTTSGWRRMLKKPSATNGMKSSESLDEFGFENTSKSSINEETLLQPIVVHDKRMRKMEMSAKLKPRPSVLFHDKLGTDDFVPGADPSNFFEQDRKLGYQKPRMWFPTPQLDLSNTLITGNPHATGSSQIVEEYLRIKALASYVGDLVIPNISTLGLSSTNQFNPSMPMNPYETILSSKLLNKKQKKPFGHTPSKDLIDPVRYANALKEALAMWTPILTSHKPKLGQKRSYALFVKSQEDEDEDEVSTQRRGDPHKVQRNVYEEEIRLPTATSQRRKVGEYGRMKIPPRIVSYQHMMQRSIEHEKSKNQEDMATIHADIDHMIANQYAQFQPKFILILEGEQAKQRKLVNRLTTIFVRHKRYNLLALAFGIWSIHIVEARSLAKRPFYARIASCHLMLNWMVKMRKNNFKLWLQKWKHTVGRMMFVERYHASIMIQKHARRVRERKTILRMHDVGPYLGILSDIKLAKPRLQLRYRIPDRIRLERKMYWLAATFIQTLFRCWIQCREYFKQKRRLILLQSIVRMWPKFKQFQRLKATTIKCQAWTRRTVQRRKYQILRAATIVVQRYVRRYLATLWKTRSLYANWYVEEVEMVAVLKIQCQIRIRQAKKVTKAKRLYLLYREWAALVIQRNWYRLKRAFHTFFLMRALAAREQADLALERLATTMGIQQCARRIQRAYRARFQLRMIDNVIRVQCWFRGRLGYFKVQRLRKVWWASRKLHHWARVRIQRWHRMALLLQKWWWHLKHRRMLKRLWYLQRRREVQVSTQRKHVVYDAASKIQAHIKGIWTRRFVKRTRAAMLIQKNFRFWNGLYKWKQWKRESSLKDIRKFVTNFIQKAIHRQVKQLCVQHSRMLIKPQALIRGFLIRVVMCRVRQYAQKLAHAAVTIQRVWRGRDVVSKAQEEVNMRRRMKNNPFQHCQGLHEVLTILNRESKQFYSQLDPRIGMKISTFLYRLGVEQLLEVFQIKKEYVFVVDIQHLTVDMMTDMYHVAMKKKAASANNKKGNSHDDDNNNKAAAKRNKQVPTAAFQLIVSYLSIPLFPKLHKQQQKLQELQHFVESSTPLQCFDYVKRLFLKKFGKHLQTRGNNFGNEILTLSWCKYNNYKQVVNPVYTKAQVHQAMQLTSESSQFLQVFQELTQKTPPPNNTNTTTTAGGANSNKAGNAKKDERKWDMDRLHNTSNLLQLAIDRAMAILPPGLFRNTVERLRNRITSYRRKYNYMLQKFQVQQGQSQKKGGKDNRKKSTDTVASAGLGSVSSNGANNGANNANSNPAPNTVSAKHPNNNSNAEHDQSASNDNSVFITSTAVSADKVHTKLTPEDSLDLFFFGEEEILIEIEFHSSICKVYMDTLEKWYLLSQAIQSIKNGWQNQALRRATKLEKRKQFLSRVTTEYIETQQRNHVKAVWERFRLRAIREKKVQNTIDAIRNRRRHIEQILQYIPKMNVTVAYDEHGFQYYIDERTGESSYEMPTYTYDHWLVVEKVQRVARKFIARCQLLRIQRAEEERLELALAEARLAEERKKALRAVEVTLQVSGDVDGNKPSKRGGTNKDKDSAKTSLAAIEAELETMVPWKYQFDKSLPLTNGMWAVLFTANGKDPIFQQRTGTYEVVIIFRLRLREDLCDIRNVKGKITRNVSTKKLRHLNYPVGLAVESRYKHRKLFYRSRIVHIDTFTAPSTTYYTVQYEDGEYETGLQRDAIRPMSTMVQQWNEEREVLFRELRLVKRRALHYQDLRRKRVKSYLSMKVADLVQAAVGEGGGSVRGEKSGPGTKKPALTRADSVQDSLDDNTSLGFADDNVAYDGNEDELYDGNLSHTRDVEEGDGPAEESTEEFNPYYEEYGHQQQQGGTAAGSEVALVQTAEDDATHFGTGHGKAMVKTKLTITRAVLRFNWEILPMIDSVEEDNEEDDEDDEEDDALLEKYRWKKLQEKKQREQASSMSLANIPPEELLFVNKQTAEEVNIDDIPLYSAVEIMLVRKVQLRWMVFKALCNFHKRIHRMNLLETIRKTIHKGCTIGFIGYHLEGLTCIQLLTRAGYAEIADIIKEHYRAIHKPISSLSIEDIATKTKEEYDRIGIIQTPHVRDLKEFQAWWKKTLPYEREKKLSLFNFYSTPNDTRSIQECIQQSLDLLVQKFTKYMKTSVTKTRAACQLVVDSSVFPHAHQQIETYLKRFADKPELARDNVNELINKVTTNTYVEEKKVYVLYRHIALQVSAALKVYHLRNMRHHVLDALKRAEDMSLSTAAAAAGAAGGGIGGSSSSNSVAGDAISVGVKSAPRPACSGVEAKAAWILRQDVFQYMMDIIVATLKLQGKIKSYLAHKKWKALLAMRIHGIDLIQRTVRKYFAYKIAKVLRSQRDAHWEQLWNHQYNVLYYFNYITGESQYEEPYAYQDGVMVACPFRPLIRDKYSAALMQAWPFLEDDPTRQYYRSLYAANIPQVMGSSQLLDKIPEQLLCVICKTRKCVRYCLDCKAVPEKKTKSSYYATATETINNHTLGTMPYCLTCYSKEHPEDNEEKSGHRYEIAGTVTGPGDSGMAIAEGNSDAPVHSDKLLCSQCNQLATRKCLGPLSDELIDEICVKLRRSHVSKWLDVLQHANIAGERKLVMLIERIMEDGSTEVQSNPDGTASNHTLMDLSKNINTISPLQIQSIRSVLERCRAECDECYCTNCYVELHSGGRRASHFWTSFAPGCVVCTVCHATPAEFRCNDCAAAEYCEPCFKVFHSMGRKRRHKKETVKEVLPASAEDGGESISTGYCDFCTRRVGHVCQLCNAKEASDMEDSLEFDPVFCCEQCFEYKHKAKCPGIDKPHHRTTVTSPVSKKIHVPMSMKEGDLSPSKKLPSTSTLLASAMEKMSAQVCVVCGEEADKKCVQCSDYYCSRVWMGHAGCFVQYHSKGNRASHTTEPYKPPPKQTLPAFNGKLTNMPSSKQLMSSTVDTKKVNLPPTTTGKFSSTTPSAMGAIAGVVAGVGNNKRA